MQFRRSGQRDIRRRRVLIEDEDCNTTDDSSRSECGGLLGYSDDARWDRQLRVTELIPRKAWVLSLLVALLLGSIGILNALHAHAPQWSSALGGSELSSLSLTSPASIAVWLASAIFLFGSVASLQIYALRRHKADDYRGRYQIWLWTAAALVFLSIDVSAGLHNIARSLLIAASGTALFGSGNIWIFIAYGTLFGALGTALVIEMRRSPATVVAAVLAAVGYTSWSLLELKIMEFTDANITVMVGASSLLAAHAFVLIALWCYARRVHREALGEIPLAASKEDAALATEERSSESAAEADEEEQQAVLKQAEVEELAAVEDQLHDSPRKSKNRKQRRSKPSTPDVLAMQDDYSDDEDLPQSAKSDRRKQRKIKLQQRQAA